MSAFVTPNLRPNLLHPLRPPQASHVSSDVCDNVYVTALSIIDGCFAFCIVVSRRFLKQQHGIVFGKTSEIQHLAPLQMLEIFRSRGEYDGYTGTSGTLVQLRSMWILHSFLGEWRLVVDSHPSLLSPHSETFK